MINIFIGYDEGEKIAYHVLSESIRRKSSEPISITPLDLSTTKNIFTREKQPNQSTEFAFSRFLVPYLSNYEGWSIFMDCDMLLRTDIKTLWDMRDDKYAVMVCKHDYEPNQNAKFRGAKNEPFPKKNWSSMMMMNNAKCKALTPEFVNTATGLELHQYRWLESEELIGSLPLTWNWLVSEYEYNVMANNVHFTLGGPYFKGYEDSDYADEWFNVYTNMVKIEL
jgi:lipopolysaccharide biosynthesis glycosyltransferase